MSGFLGLNEPSNSIFTLLCHTFITLVDVTVGVNNIYACVTADGCQGILFPHTGYQQAWPFVVAGNWATLSRGDNLPRLPGHVTLIV